MSLFKKTVKSILQKFDIGVVRYQELQRLKNNKVLETDLDFILSMPPENSTQLLTNLKKSKSQLRQDLFVLSTLGFKKNGFFVEFGATNGIDLSNTYLLEKDFQWTGILAEPALCWHNQLKLNRNAKIETNCVWKDSVSSLTFTEVDVAELSTINSFKDTDLHKNARNNNTSYVVKTISLNDLLDKYNAPAVVDFLSIDTEGSEFDILNALNFEKYSFRVIACEHNFTPMREKIYSLLTKHGYVRVHTELSQFDDWYINNI